MWLTWSTVSNFEICEETKHCPCAGFNTIPAIYSIGKDLPWRRRDRPDLILPGDLHTREQQVLRLVVWGIHTQPSASLHTPPVYIDYIDYIKTV